MSETFQERLWDIGFYEDETLTHTYPITLNDPWFDYVKQGIKKYEGRCYWKSVLKYQINDLLKISHHTDLSKKPYIVKIKHIVLYPTFEEALKTLPLEEVLPGVSTIEEGIHIYLKFVSLDTQLTYGVCMIEVEPI
jgi:ASC-1-like (ASCH) protein